MALTSARAPQQLSPPHPPWQWPPLENKPTNHVYLHSFQMKSHSNKAAKACVKLEPQSQSQLQHSGILFSPFSLM